MKSTCREYSGRGFQRRMKGGKSAGGRSEPQTLFGPVVSPSRLPRRALSSLPPAHPPQRQSSLFLFVPVHDAVDRPRRRRPARRPQASNTMADGSRRKLHRPILVVANPDVDSSDEDSHVPRQSSSLSPSSCAPSHNRFIAPLISRPHISLGPLNTTNLPDRSARHPAYSNPTLSSPSGTSSPPPSTPGQLLPPVDIPGERPDGVHVSNSTDAIPQQHSFFPTPRMRFFDKPKQTRKQNGRPATVRPFFSLFYLHAV